MSFVPIFFIKAFPQCITVICDVVNFVFHLIYQVGLQNKRQLSRITKRLYVIVDLLLEGAPQGESVIVLLDIFKG